MSFLRKVGLQFKNPTGIAGQIISDMMIIGNRPSYETLIKDLKIQPGNRILEIGYGPGVGIDIISYDIRLQTSIRQNAIIIFYRM